MEGERLAPSAWEDFRWFVWDGGFLVLGTAEGIVPEHAHHGIQLMIATDGELAIRASDGGWLTGRGLVVRADVRHSFDGRGALGALMFIDPESSEGAWLSSLLTEDVTVVPEARVEPCVAELKRFLERPLEAMDAPSFIRHCVRCVCAGVPPSRKLDERVGKVLQAIRERDDLRLSLEDAAAKVFLSPSRFAHMFTEQVGLPFRRYLLWRKVSRAMVAMGHQRTLAAAAQAADFADAAHLTRTFQQMFGMAPSMMAKGDVREIESPFDLAA